MGLCEGAFDGGMDSCAIVERFVGDEVCGIGQNDLETVNAPQVSLMCADIITEPDSSRRLIVAKDIRQRHIAGSVIRSRHHRFAISTEFMG